LNKTNFLTSPGIFRPLLVRLAYCLLAAILAHSSAAFEKHTKPARDNGDGPAVGLGGSDVPESGAASLAGLVR
jgi:hypothetical protein